VLLDKRHGFEVVEELILPKTDVRGWLMLRPPMARGARPAEAASEHLSPHGSG